MASIEIIALILTGLSISASIIYYSQVLSNSNKAQKLQQESRQTTTYIQTIGFRDADFMKAHADVMYFQKYDSYEEWMSKYHPTGLNYKDEYLDSYANFFSIGNAFQSTGLLVSQGIVDPELVYDQARANFLLNSLNRWGLF